MVRLASQQRERAVELLGNDQTCETVGKGHRREGHDEVGAAANRIAEPLATAHDERRVAPLGLNPANPLGERAAGQGAPSLVERDDGLARLEPMKEGGALFLDGARGILRLSRFGQLDELETAVVCEPAGVLLHPRFEEAGAVASHGDEADLHGPRVGQAATRTPALAHVLDARVFSRLGMVSVNQKLCGMCGTSLPASSSACPRCGAPAASLPSPGAVESPTELMPIRVGDLFEGKWRIESKLGAGGMGAVFLAHDLALDRKVAIKVLARELSLDAQFVLRFEREAQVTARLEHPNIVPVYAVGRHNNRPFMVMKKLDGATLASRLQAEGRLDPARTLDVMRQVCSGLAHIHAHGWVHRDIKSGNVILSPNGHATILDFGVLRDPNSRGTTQAGMMLGTPRYMSPEQAQGVIEIDHRADLYALGVLLFECLTGHAPFEAPSDLAIIHMHARMEPPDILALNPDLPACLGPMVRRALAKAPEERYASAAEFCAALEAALEAPNAAPAFGELVPPAVAKLSAADPNLFDPSLLPVQNAPDPQPVAEQVLEAGAASVLPARKSSRWLWPAVAAVAALVAGAELAYFHSGKWTPSVLGTRGPGDDSRAEKHASSELKKPVKLYGVLKVVSVLSGKPYPAAVEVDGVGRGETPLSVEVTAGKHVVRVFRKGFQAVERDIVVSHRQTTILRVDLIP